MKQTAALLVVALFLHEAAHAQQRRPVVLFGGLSSQGELSHKGASYNEPCLRRISGIPKYSVVPAQTVEALRRKEFYGTGSPQDQEKLAQARNLLVEGKAKAFSAEKRSLENAERLLDHARQLFLSHLSSLKSNRDLLSAQLYLGAVRIGLKKYDEAQQAFEQVVYLNPDQEISASEFTPQVMTAFAKAKQSISELDSSRVTIESQPPGASVFLNAKLLGKSPLSVNLKRGEYFFLMERAGHEAWYKPVTLERGVEFVSAQLKPSVALRSWQEAFGVREPGTQADDELLLRVANGARADLVFLATLEDRGGPRLLSQWFDVRSGQFSKVGMADLGGQLEGIPPACADSIETLGAELDAQGRVRNNPNLNYQEEDLRIAEKEKAAVSPSTQTPSAGSAWYTKWWIYPLVIAVGVGIYFGAQELGSKGGAKIKINNEGNL